MADDNKPFNILVAREYTDGNGEVKTEWLRAGVAFKNKQGGFNGKVPAGLALTGDFVILPRREKAGDDGPEHDEQA